MIEIHEETGRNTVSAAGLGLNGEELAFKALSAPRGSEPDDQDVIDQAVAPYVEWPYCGVVT